MIDLRIHLEAQKKLYTDAIDSMAENKRALHNFRLPNPDFKTALEVLTTGKASWMPDVSIPPCSQDRSMLTNLAELHPTPTIDRYRSFGIPREAQHSAFYTT